MGLLTALALSCHVNEVSMFDRKHYFYADLPAGYQITQQRFPLANDGVLKFQVFNPGKHKTPYVKSSKLKQIQLEQDSGKSLHDEGAHRSLIDLNRAGIPLMELVFEPDLSDGEEAAALVKELVLILLKINTCSCKMEEGALRVDANISIHRIGEPFGVRTEVKNIGSIRGVANAIDFEIERQIKVLESEGEITNETRSWDPISSQTLPMRDKEVKQDYRFMPEPNLPPLRVNIDKNKIEGLINVEELKALLPELPEVTRQKLKEKYGLPMELILQLVNEETLLLLFVDIMSANPKRIPKTVGNILCIELLTLLNKGLYSLGNRKFNSKNLGEIIDLLQNGEINLITARHIMDEIAYGNPLSPHEIIDKADLKQISDPKILFNICQKAIKENPKIVTQYKSGKTKVFPALLGIIAKETQNKANMKIIVDMLKDLLEK
ncbi:glutamyl-tRNA(Gln) amidotransferase subunit B, mitochondrial isoform X2 [Rhodnius prolixus]